MPPLSTSAKRGERVMNHSMRKTAATVMTEISPAILRAIARLDVPSRNSRQAITQRMISGQQRGRQHGQPSKYHEHTGKSFNHEVTRRHTKKRRVSIDPNFFPFVCLRVPSWFNFFRGPADTVRGYRAEATDIGFRVETVTTGLSFTFVGSGAGVSNAVTGWSV